MKQENNPFCLCGGRLTEFDRCGESSTARCDSCHACSLIIQGSGLSACIPLRDFHRKRGDGNSQRPFHDLGMAERLVACLRADEWPSQATVLDFGIRDERHLGALQHAVRSGITAYDLDRVIGDGRAITCLVYAVPGQPFADIQFQTAYDGVDAATWTGDGVDAQDGED
jgi:hypothetical protein